MSYNGAAALNMPLVADRVALRASGLYSHDGGYIDNPLLASDDVNRSDVYGGRVDLLLTPTEELSVRFGGYVQDIDRDGKATADHTFAGEAEAGSLEHRRPLREPFEQHFRLVSGTINYEFTDATLTSISSYQTSYLHPAAFI